MNEIDIIEYIRQWLILQNLQQESHFDCIFFEDLDSKIIDQHSSKLNIKTLKDFWFDFSINWKLISEIDRSKNILVVIDSLNINYLVPFIKKAKEKNINFCIINLWAGTSSALNKNIIEGDDVSLMLNYDVDINETFDFVTLFNFLNKKNQNYIRIPHKTLTWNMIKDNQIQININENIISFKEAGLAWYDWTIITWASIMQDTIQYTSIARQNWKNFDVFCVLNYNFNFTEDLAQSIKSTEKLIIVIDQIYNENFTNKIKAKLWDMWFIDCKIIVISPSLPITTKVKEHFWENIWFDWMWIYEKLSNI